MAEKKVLVTKQNLGAWVLKCNPEDWNVEQVITRCGTSIIGGSVADTYRIDLMQAGQPVVFWVSGPMQGPRVFRGIWGLGRLTSEAMLSKGLSNRDARDSLWLDFQKATKPAYD